MDKEKTAIDRLKTASEMSFDIYGKPLLITYSGGKDSDVLLLLAERSGVPYEVNHSHTTVDAPPTVYHVREKFKSLEEKVVKCSIDYPYYKGKRTNMFDLIVQKKFPPTRLIRYCCEVLKEHSGDGRFIVTGVRWAESRRRKNTRGIYEGSHNDRDKRIILTNDNDDKRRLTESCFKRKKMVCNPIIDWETSDVYDYLEESRIKLNPLYCMGFHRVGCVGCPMAGKHIFRDFTMFPKYRDLYVKAFDRMLIVRREAGLTENKLSVPWENGEDVFRWWVGLDHAQLSFEDIEKFGGTEND